MIWISMLTPMIAMAEQVADCRIELRDVTSPSKITFRHTDGESGHRYLYELMVAGLALFDYDNDGWTDVYLLNGASTHPLGRDRTSRNRLYRNNGDWTFSDVTEQAGVGDARHALGVAVGDTNEDGHLDLYVNNFGGNVLYRNNGDGTFDDVTLLADVGCGDKFGAGTCFLDADGDGALDLYVAHYVRFSTRRHDVRAANAFPYPPGPRDYHPVADTLFRNNGDGTYSDVSEISGISAVAGPSMGMICIDFDEDGDTDIFVCNDGSANFLFKNDGHGRFEECGLITGVAFDSHATENGSMGVDSGDFDGDGRLDLFMTDYTAEMPVLYRNAGGSYYEDATNASRAGNAVYPHTNWGAGFADCDNDGDQDLFIANGHFLTNVPEIDQRTAYRVRNCLLMNCGDGKFVDVSAHSGNGLEVTESSRGVGFADLDGDGNLDVCVLNANAPPTVLRNTTRTAHHWLDVRLRGTRTCRQAVGSRVYVKAGHLKLVAEVHSGRGYQSYYGTWLHFGLGDVDHVDRVEVHWHGGVVEIFHDIPVDQRVLLTEGAAQRRTEGELDAP